MNKTSKLVGLGWIIAIVAMALSDAPVPGSGADLSQDKGDKSPTAPTPAKLGLMLNDPKAFQGYTLFSPLDSKTTFLIDMQGKVVHSWEGAATPACSAYLLANGHLLRPCLLTDATQPTGAKVGPAGGRVQEFTWEGELVWDFKCPKDRQQHHDVLKLANGNVLLLVWDDKSAQDAVDAGRGGVGKVQTDSVIEIKPTGKTTGDIVWEWHLWDHLIQDHDASKANHGDVAGHAELVDVNFGVPLPSPKDEDKVKDKDKDKPAGKAKQNKLDWTHTNALAFNADLDQIMLSVHEFSEIWIIDHGTTTAQSKGHEGGKHGKGGDLLYRWGNPLAYRAGKAADQQLFAQHNAHWIPKGLQGEGHLLVFNNGNRRPGGEHSTVDEIVLPVDAGGQYARKGTAAFGPDKAIWSYSAPNKQDFFSFYISGAQRLPNGHTFICSGASGILFEVTPQHDMVWKYVNPVLPKQQAGKPGPPKGGMGGQPGGGAVFRGTRLTPNYAALVGKDLTPGKTVEEILQAGGSKEAKADPYPKDVQPTKEESKAKVGLALNDPKAFQGYTLFAPMTSTKTYLIDMQGKVVRTWESDATPALSAYLLPNGHLLRPATLFGMEPFKGGGFGGKDGPGGKGGGPGGKDGPGGKGGGPGGPGAGGRIQEFTWEGELVWDFKFSSDTQQQHHDICPLPNGNVLLIAWDKKTSQEAAAAGRKVGGNLNPDCIVEIQPMGKTDGKIVWEWHVWDHLIQDHDKTKANYGNVAAHPELIDLNYGAGFGAKLNQKDVDKLKGIGYLGGGAKLNPDWTHFNCVAYNADFDQIMVSVHEFSEIWIIDHGTTKAEAAGHTGGKSGKGGDLLYRWGNPIAYRAGTAKDQKLFAQHNAHWIPKGLRGQGHLLVFNNGMRRPDGNYSSVDEIVLPVDANGHYSRLEGVAFGPDAAAWSYTAPKKTDFFSMLISGAQRLPNGNTLICSGIDGTVFEVTGDREIVWKYVNPSKGAFGPGFGFPGGFDPKKGGTGGFDPKKGDLGGFDPKKGGPGGFDPKGGFQPPFGMPGMGGFGPAGSSLFRSTRYGPDYPGLNGRDLTPGRTIEEMESKDAKKG